MTVILHIGLPKTGTTYLQEWLSLNRERLAQDGISAISSESSHRFAAEALSDPALCKRSDVVAIRETSTFDFAIEELRNCGEQSSVISSEYFFHCDPTLVADMMKAIGNPVSKILCFVRRQDRISASGYAQEVKTLGMTTRISDYSEVSYTPFLDWNNIAETWQQAFPLADIAFHNFDACSANGSLLDIFRSEIGDVGAEPLMLTERVNESLSAHLTEFVRMMNEKRQRTSLSRLMEIQKGTNYPPYSFDQRFTQLFEETYIQSNRALADRFPNRFDEFCEPGWRPTGIDMTDKLGPEEIARILCDYVSVAE
ncbi:hypothetical protein J2T09_002672 [Neorhizobium huautlense]|uniref:Sulfotransferase family protein n=1 Tax=Neorhizobium huautlense TaxID=67774 RepID=A0ABT9PTW3_9HYPH|nr:hypothetical protein [Neorhizobium huautlense]MDP9837912.1 hypothetical protein [Neorhizobium huautlense]